MDRNLDGVYFRVKRGEKWENVCFSDLNDSQMISVLNGKNVEFLKSLCAILGKRIKLIGDQFDIVSVDKEDDEE